MVEQRQRPLSGDGISGPLGVILRFVAPYVTSYEHKFNPVDSEEKYILRFGHRSHYLEVIKVLDRVILRVLDSCGGRLCSHHTWTEEFQGHILFTLQHQLKLNSCPEPSLIDTPPPNEVWFQTYSRRQFTLSGIETYPYTLEEIAHSLSRVCRYLGHVEGFYSVAEHCVLLSRSLPPEMAAWGLLHDAMEAYLGDIPRPWKSLITLFEGYENRGLKRIAQMGGLVWPIPDLVHQYDKRIAWDEIAVLKGGLVGTQPPGQSLGLTSDQIQGWLPDRASVEYLKRAEELGIVLR